MTEKTPYMVLKAFPGCLPEEEPEWHPDSEAALAHACGDLEEQVENLELDHPFRESLVESWKQAEAVLRYVRDNGDKGRGWAITLPDGSQLCIEPNPDSGEENHR